MTGFTAILRALVLRPFVREPLRASLTILGIAVGVAVLVAIQLSNQSALRSFEESVDAVAGRANFQIVSEAAPLDEEILLALRPLWDAGGRFAPVIDIEGSLGSSGIPVRILAVDLLSDLHFRNYRYASIARASEDTSREAGVNESTTTFLELFRPDSVVVPESFARQHNLKLGSSVELVAGSSSARFKVRGILLAEGPATAFNGSIVVLDIGAAQQAFGLHGKLTRVDLMIPEERVEEVRSAIEIGIPEQSRLERPSRRNERVERMLAAFRLNLFALSGVALLVGVFLVYNTVLMSVLRRKRTIGMMRTLGVGRGQLLSTFLFEGSLFGIFGSALGIALGTAIANAILATVAQTINALYVTTDPTGVSLTPGVVTVAMIAGTVASTLASVQPAMEASSTPPLALVRPDIRAELTRARRGPVIAAVVCFGLAYASTKISPVDGVSIGGYLSVLLIVAGVSFLCPSLLLTVSSVLRKPFTRAFRIPGQLSSASMPASLRRVAVATAALGIATAMMVAVALMVGSFRETVDVWVDQTVQSDLWLRPARNLSNSQIATFPPEISDALDQIDMVEAYDRIRGKDLVYRDSMILIAGGDFATALEHSRLPMIVPSTISEAIETCLSERGVLVSETFSYRFDASIGDVIEIPTAKGLTRFPIGGVYRDYSNDRGVVLMDRSVWIDEFEDSSINTIAVFLRDGIDPDEARIELERTLGAQYKVFATTNVSIRTEVMRIFDQTFLVTWALLGIALTVAILGIVNTLTAIIVERRAEIALLKVVGVSQGQITAMLALESSIIGLCSTAIGVVSGWVLAIILIRVINRQAFGWTIEFAPPGQLIIISITVTFLCTLLAGLIPSGVARRVAMSTELKSE